MLIVLCVLVWWAVGFSGFVYWWASEFDVQTDDLILGCVMGIMGPITWPMGAMIHNPRKTRKQREHRVWLERRGR